MPSSLRRALTTDHQRLARLVHRAAAPGPSRERWQRELESLLQAHLAAESEVLHGDPGRQAGLRPSDDAETGEDLVTAARAVDESAFESLLVQHEQALDAGVLTSLEQVVPRKELRRLGGEYVARRDAATGENNQPVPRRLDVSRAELYEMARRAGIEGRSTMSRGDLIVALRRTSADPQ